MGLTQEIAGWIVKSSYTDLPPETIEAAKGLLLKTITGMVAGSREPVGRTLTTYLSHQGGSPDAGVVCGRFRTSVENSAMALGTFAHASELEDDMIPGTAGDYWMLPAFFSLGESLVSSGAEIIMASVISFEVSNRLGMGGIGERAHTERHLCPTAWLGTIGTAAGAARLLKLGVKETVNALSIAASHAGSLLAQVGTDSHFLESGHSCRAGVMSALLAKEGVTGQPDILERKGGLLDVVGIENVDLRRDTEDIGKPPFAVHQVWVKKYPCCLLMHTAIDALSMLVAENKVRNEDVSSVEVHQNVRALNFCSHPADSIPNLRFSFYHSLGEVLLRGTVDQSTFTQESKIVDPELDKARRKVKLVPNPEWTGPMTTGGATVVIVMNDGKKLSKHMDQPIGSPESPLTNEQIAAINRQYVKGILSDEQARRVEEIALNMDNEPDILELMDILTFRQAHQGIGDRH